MKNLRFRQVHLDFHTSPDISGIGERFDRRQWQETLKRAHVNSITCFSLCHHGWSYHPTEVGAMHPHLKFDLLREQFEAAKEIDINVPVYLSAGLNYRVSQLHPEWNEVSPQGKGMDPFWGGFVKLCFNTPYLDFLCEHITETARLFPGADGIFLDIIAQGECCCPHCVAGMLKAGLDPEQSADRRKFAASVLQNYYTRTTAAARRDNPNMPVFHNSGHVAVGNTSILKYFSHLELESLPTGGWGYDHYPLSAAYSRNLGMQFLGMTGKFHTTWGEFGGFKHPNALRYECAAMLANGSKCSIGDQLHPDGALDASTYDIIGEAYAEVEAKEPWCDDVRSLANLAILSSAGANRNRANDVAPDTGAGRLLLEGHIPFDMVDCDMDFGRYKFLLLPDDVPVDGALKAKLDAFTAGGGKLILSAGSGLGGDGGGAFALDLPLEDFGWNELSPDFIEVDQEFSRCFVKTPFVMYRKSRRIKVKPGFGSLGRIYDPYFVRSYRHFCSHQHTPYRPDPSGFDAGAVSENILYFAHPVFTIYRIEGAVCLKEFVLNAIIRFMGADRMVDATLPGTGRVTLMEQPGKNRAILHLLYANTVARGGGRIHESAKMLDIPTPIEVIEELNSCGAVRVRVRPGRKIGRVRLVPEGRELEFSCSDGAVEFTVPEFTCHAMVELAYV